MNRFMMANSQQCIGCRACEVACVMAHNDEQHVLTPEQFSPRITVIKHQQQCNAVTCHHCEDAPCARSCPNGAISRVNDSVQINQQRCIGCKSCVIACPFGTLQVLITPTGEGKVKATAHKCDLCLERRDGPACGQHCPTHALQEVNNVTLTKLVQSRRLRSASQEAQPWHKLTVLPPASDHAKVRQMHEIIPEKTNNFIMQMHIALRQGKPYRFPVEK